MVTFKKFKKKVKANFCRKELTSKPKAKKCLLTMMFMKVPLSKVSPTEKVKYPALIKTSMMVIGKTGMKKGKVKKFSQIKMSMKANGHKAITMAKVL